MPSATLNQPQTPAMALGTLTEVRCPNCREFLRLIGNAPHEEYCCSSCFKHFMKAGQKKQSTQKPDEQDANGEDSTLRKADDSNVQSGADDTIPNASEYEGKTAESKAQENASKPNQTDQLDEYRKQTEKYRVKYESLQKELNQTKEHLANESARRSELLAENIRIKEEMLALKSKRAEEKAEKPVCIKKEPSVELPQRASSPVEGDLNSLKQKLRESMSLLESKDKGLKAARQEIRELQSENQRLHEVEDGYRLDLKAYRRLLQLEEERAAAASSQKASKKQRLSSDRQQSESERSSPQREGSQQ